MDSMITRSAANDASMTTDAVVTSQQGFDLPRVLWRWKWLPILGAIIGSGVGYMYYTKLPQLYKSEALIQVVSPVPVISQAELYDGSKVASWGSSGDESRAIKSRIVLGLAVKAGSLEKYFPDMSTEEIVWLLNSPKKGVEVKPADKLATNTQQLLISYTSEDPEVSHSVVAAVVEGYQTFLEQEYETVDTEVLSYFTAQQTALDKKYEELQQKHNELRSRAPKDVPWKVDQPIDPYAENYARRLDQAERLRDAQTTLKADLAQVLEGKQKGRNPADLLMMLAGDKQETNNYWQQWLDKFVIKEDEELESEILKRRDLVVLETKEARLRQSLGDSHPTVKNVQGEIESMKLRIAAAEKAETEKRLRETADQNGGSKQLSGPQYLLEVMINSSKEKGRSMVAEEEELRRLAAEDLKKSQAFQSFVLENRMISEKMEEVKEVLKLYTAKLDSVDLDAKNVNQRILRELDPASPGIPAGPFPARYLLAGSAVGILLMSGLAVLMDLADRSYRSPEEIVADLGIPVLGHVPAMDPKKLKRTVEGVDASVVTLHHGRGRVAESYRSIRTALFFSNKGADLKVVQVTSPVPGDGKSTLSSNLAVALAQSGRKVLLIDADFRRPRIEKIFGIEQDVGMVQLVTGKVELDQALCTSCVPNLSILPGGKRPSNPAELLSSSRFTEVIAMLREKFDLIIIDTPPVLAVSDPAVVSSVVDGVVVTMRLRRNIKPLAARTLATLEAVDAPIIGVVINGVSTEAAYGGYGYNYSYNDYRYSYRYSENKYGYGKYRQYSQYTAGYVDDDSEQSNAGSDNANSAT